MSEDFKCPMCGFSGFEPKMCPNCGCDCCTGCIVTTFEGDDYCPNCEEEEGSETDEEIDPAEGNEL